MTKSKDVRTMEGEKGKDVEKKKELKKLRMKILTFKFRCTEVDCKKLAVNDEFGCYLKCVYHGGGRR